MLGSSKGAKLKIHCNAINKFNKKIGSNQILLVEEKDLKLNTSHIYVVTMEDIHATQVTCFLRDVFIQEAYENDVSYSRTGFTFKNRKPITVENWSLDMSQNQICNCLGTVHVFLHKPPGLS